MQIRSGGHLEKQNGRQIVQNRGNTGNRAAPLIFKRSLQMKYFWIPCDQFSAITESFFGFLNYIFFY